jgi:hypothetical protein
MLPPPPSQVARGPRARPRRDVQGCGVVCRQHAPAAALRARERGRGEVDALRRGHAGARRRGHAAVRAGPAGAGAPASIERDDNDDE